MNPTNHSLNPENHSLNSKHHVLNPESNNSDEERTQRLGIDVGGTTIKAAIVEMSTGTLASEVVTTDTPPGATPDQVGALVVELRNRLGYEGPLGCALPGIVEGDCLFRAHNLSDSWADAGALQPFTSCLGPGIVLLNDADAVGLTELHYGTLQTTPGFVVVLTFGTGIGSALLFEGRLVPNVELGELSGSYGTFEQIASGHAITRDALTAGQWVVLAQPYFDELERLLRPEQWIMAGGVSNSFSDYFTLVNLAKPIRVAHFGQHAGIVGAAVATLGSAPLALSPLPTSTTTPQPRALRQ